MRIFIVFSIILLIATGLLFWYRGGNPYRNLANLDSPGTGIIAFGDSLTEGVGAPSPKHAWPAVVSENLGVEVRNAGRAGDMTADALLRLERDVFLQNPKLVIIFLGANDMLRGVPIVETLANLETMIKKIQDKKAMILLVGIRGITQRNLYHEQFERLAKIYRIAYLSDPMTRVFLEPRLMSEDRIHPNDEGYRILADAIGTEIEKILAASVR